jgi:hypothetical protein
MNRVGWVCPWGYGDLHSMLYTLDLAKWSLPASALVFVLLGFWLHRYGRADVWVRLGVTALVARLWIYHRLYDDLLVILPLVAVYRLACAGTTPVPRKTAAGLLVAVSLVVMLIPARLHTAAFPWWMLFNESHLAVWLVLLCFLHREAARQRCAPAMNAG